MIRRGSRIVAALAALLLFLAAAVVAGAAQGEAILSFDSVVDIDADAGLTVTETITVLSTGESIRHGLVREFPTRYDAPGRQRVEVGFRVLSVRCDGSKEDYRIKDAANGKMVYMGRKDALLPPGRHTYVLTYRTDGQIGQFAGYDELYWNVTGNGWRLPIERATALVRLPPGAAVQQLPPTPARPVPKGGTSPRARTTARRASRPRRRCRQGRDSPWPCPFQKGSSILRPPPSTC